jgi:drug/metabolite transporter (DMT)-like permease
MSAGAVPHARHGEAHNLRGILAMLASMAAFTANDICVKLASSALPLGEIILMRGATATLVILLVIWRTGGLVLPPDAPWRLLSWRLVGEIAATILFLSALLHLPIADVTAIGQFTPLALTAAAALFLGEPVGWRRWSAALVGFCGVLLIVRPGSAAFSAAGLMAFASLGFVVLRDLATRRIADTISTPVLTLMSAVAVGLSGLLLAPFETWRLPGPRELALLLAAGTALAAAYALIVVALRTGEIAVVSPFRYSVILWAIAAGVLIWGEVPDAASLAGIAIVAGAGLYTFHRERVARRRRARVLASRRIAP